MNKMCDSLDPTTGCPPSNLLNVEPGSQSVCWLWEALLRGSGCTVDGRVKFSIFKRQVFLGKVSGPIH